MIKPNQPKLRSLYLALGIALGSVGLAMPGFAITLTDTDPAAAASWTQLGWKVEGRAGVLGSGDYELAIGPNGAGSGLTGKAEWIWGNNEEVPWTLNWNGTTAAFTFGNLAPISYTSATSNIFNGFYLLTNAVRDNRVTRGTQMTLRVNNVNGTTITDPNIFASSRVTSSGSNFLDQVFFSSSEAIRTLGGTVRMSWLNPNPQAVNARSRLTFALRGYNTGSTPAPIPTIVSTSAVIQSAGLPPTVASIPEANSTLGLLALSAMGASSMLIQKQQQKAKLG
jgi:hypothetical protein